MKSPSHACMPSPSRTVHMRSPSLCTSTHIILPLPCRRISPPIPMEEDQYPRLYSGSLNEHQNLQHLRLPETYLIRRTTFQTLLRNNRRPCPSMTSRIQPTQDTNAGNSNARSTTMTGQYASNPK